MREALRNRNMDPAPVDQVLALDVDRRALLSQVEALKAERNRVSKEIGKMKDPAERQAKIDAMRVVGDQIAEQDEQGAPGGDRTPGAGCHHTQHS